MPKKGSVSLLIVILIMAGMLIISFGVSTLLVRQIKMAIASGESIVAYQAADSGIERAYFALSQDATTTTLFLGSVGLASNQVCSGAAPLWTAVGSASFCLDVYSTPQGYVSGIKSIGHYKTTNRAIQVGSQ
jgi:hypothetical protein